MFNLWIIISIIFFILLGIYTSWDRYLNQVKAKIVVARCKFLNNRYLCDLIITYEINNVMYKNILKNINQKTPFQPGDKIPIFYNNVDPSIIQYGYNHFIISFICFIIAGILIYVLYY
jgi:hypothetical protein